MNAKIFVTIGLLLFVAASVIGTVLKDPTQMPAGPQKQKICGCITLPKTGPQITVPTATKSTLPKEVVAAIYFHGDTRCPTCRKIEATAEETIATKFAEELKHGAVTWQDVNYEVPADKHFLDDFALVAPSLVLVKTNNGQQVAWRNLDRVWELVGDRAAFSAYVEDGISSYLKEEGSKE